MSQSVITTAFEQLKAEQAANGGVLELDEFVFANVPGLNITDPIDRAEGLPPAGQIVHRQAVSKTGVANNNAVVYSVILGAETGDFEFNWIGLLNTSSNTVAMIVHAPLQKKIKTLSGQQGNVLTRSFMMEYDGASQITQITTPADTWQIDFTARLAGIDERIRKENADIYGAASFFYDGFLVGRSDAGYVVNKGVGYIYGLRAELLLDKRIAPAELPVKVWVDVCWKGLLTSVWDVETKIAVAETLNDYSDNGQQHYVFAIAEIHSDGDVVDLRGSTVKPSKEIITDIKSDLAFKQPLNENLTALSKANPDKEQVVFFDSDGKIALSDFSDFGQEFLSHEDASEALSSLGILGVSKYGAPLIGQLVEWPLEQMPQEIWADCGMEFIPYIGQSFDAVKYPLLSQLHPTNVLPADMRGYGVRGWDNARGVDTGRALMSAQSSGAPNITGDVGALAGVFTPSGNGAMTFVFSGLNSNAAAGTDSGLLRIGIDASKSSKEYQAITEVRSKNVAWHMIVRAK